MRIDKIVGCLLAALAGAMAAPMAMAAPEDMPTNNVKEPNTKHMGKEMTKKPATGMPNSPTGNGNGKTPMERPILYLVGDSTMAAMAVADEVQASKPNGGNPPSVKDSVEEEVSQRKRDEDDTGKPAGNNNGEPAGTKNGEPAGTKNGEPAGTKNGEPAGTKNGEPAGTNNGKPAGTKNGEPAGTKNGEPAGTNNGKPAGTKNGEPAGNNNDKPKTANNHKAPVKLERQGWGSALPEFMKIQIVNLAISGRSARSYTNENRFKTLATKVKKGDYVVIQFGHNDVGTPKRKIDNGRAACPPVNNKYSTTCKTTFHGKPETVLTYHTYLVQAAKLLKSKGANVIILSPTPKNPWASGTYKFKPNIFAKYAADAAKAADVTFIDHGNVTSALFQNMTAKVVDSYYQGATHFTPAGARVIAHEFVEALESSESTLKKYIKMNVEAGHGNQGKGSSGNDPETGTGTGTGTGTTGGGTEKGSTGTGGSGGGSGKSGTGGSGKGSSGSGSGSGSTGSKGGSEGGTGTGSGNGGSTGGGEKGSTGKGSGSGGSTGGGQKGSTEKGSTEKGSTEKGSTEKGSGSGSGGGEKGSTGKGTGTGTGAGTGGGSGTGGGEKGSTEKGNGSGGSTGGGSGGSSGKSGIEGGEKGSGSGSGTGGGSGGGHGGGGN